MTASIAHEHSYFCFTYFILAYFTVISCYFYFRKNSGVTVEHCHHVIIVRLLYSQMNCETKFISTLTLLLHYLAKFKAILEMAADPPRSLVEVHYV